MYVYVQYVRICDQYPLTCGNKLLLSLLRMQRHVIHSLMFWRMYVTTSLWTWSWPGHRGQCAQPIQPSATEVQYISCSAETCYLIVFCITSCHILFYSILLVCSSIHNVRTSEEIHFWLSFLNVPFLARGNSFCIIYGLLCMFLSQI